MNIVAIQKSTGMFLESHELGFDKNTLMRNALSCGFNKDDIEIKELSNSELDIILKAEHEASLTYADKRREEYNQLNQFEMQFDDQRDGTTTWVDKINEIKQRYPK